MFEKLKWVIVTVLIVGIIFALLMDDEGHSQDLQKGPAAHQTKPDDDVHNGAAGIATFGFPN